ncbi:hypothetical protein SPRG_06193 [Saprolegnia parasitica CBS 223.65]|uniref:Uncharacterized protein n=1 Tax=Saprolegnia parasitica (strain CBS 223.65) TaxID=695850 RepID=A0A067CNP3_SAPPC|nr:hypothetical protein SPRG_06193 [Saprolegnia parasitica CBS 223.65]KDO28146.1 hypothetical protein SPRG_06193 [Saprolegnia parasitica CBS 223.65]|eukprot:XP_012200973.1 hypothetical protein SPRG_06193 [Saprolegnia parasitica CBS 223.65]
MGVWITNGRDEAIEVATVERATMRQLRDAAQAHFALATDGRPLMLMASDAHCMAAPRVASERALILPTRSIENYGSNDTDAGGSVPATQREASPSY